MDWLYSGRQISHKIDVQNKDSDVRNLDNDVRNRDSDVRDIDIDVRDMASDVRNRNKIPVLIPDIEIWCPEHGQFYLSMFRTSKCDVRNMDS